ncbi:iron compound ABC transporter iron compound-binding protein [Siminovitchia terrae]|uniref:Iron compound ABC transporter iron compound-binding protein n=1 Tax=Siminovitchia terrae TaxID=1914933 RepID=A0ABQ4KYV5_SIMTE|nr:ABC transporter substrate-binding protein [Siminovitchia terrae]GIN97218.1 iron compound ABC transporter iron compound-binding protein [Siminovitchia terrae]
MKRKMLLSTIILPFLLMGCSQSQSKEDYGTPSSTAASVTDFADRTVTFEHVPERIVALSNGDIDIVYAFGDEVVGRPNSNGGIAIKEAENAEEVGSTHSIDIEKITALQPDVVLGGYPMNLKDVPAIEGTGAKVILTGANSVDDIKKQVGLLGEVLGKEDKSKEIIADIDHKVEEIQSELPEEKPRVLLVYGAPGTNMAALPNSLSGNLLEMAGGENIASDYPGLDSYPQYAQLNTERIIESNPEIILLMSHGNPEEVKDSFTNEMKKNAGWKDLDAVKNDRFIILPSELFGTNPGTQVTESLEFLQKTFKEMK